MNNPDTSIENLNDRLQKLKEVLNIPQKESELKQLEAESTDPKLWDDQENAKTVLQNLSNLKNELDEIKDVTETLEILNEVNDENELVKLERVISKLELKSYLSSPYDNKNAIITIHAGQGGTEAMDWAQMLLRMYLRFCERWNYATQVIDDTPGEEAGIKSVVFKVGGPHAYGYLKGEAGTHRLVRQSPFNADKLRQTSFALVEVLPDLVEVDLPDIEIKDSDLEWQFFHSSSQGGQNVQKVSTAVRLTHKPTGIVVTSQRERFQEANRKLALGLLRSKLWIKKRQVCSAAT